MRLSTEELGELFLPRSQQFHDALYAGCIKAGKSDLGRLTDSDKASLLSHIIRSEAFEYLLKNPMDGFALDRRAHRQNQSVRLRHESGLEVRVVRLTSFRPAINVPISGIDEDPTITQAIAQLELQFQAPGVVGISWETPTFVDLEPTEEIPLTLIRAVEGTKLRNGRADAIIPLHGSSNLIPEASFNPDLADTRFTIEDEDAHER